MRLIWFKRPQSAPELNGNLQAFEYGSGQTQVRRLARKSSIQIHQMKARGPLLLPVQGHGQGIVAVFGGPGCDPLLQPHALAPLEIDGGNQFKIADHAVPQIRRCESALGQSEDCPISRGLSPYRQKVAQQLLARFLAFLRMKLRSPDPVPARNRAKETAIIRPAEDVLLAVGSYKVGVDKVEITPIRYPS